MALNRGPQDNWVPTDGRQDARPIVNCSSCGARANCYRGPLLRVEHTTHGDFNVWRYLCATCMALTVGEALRDS